MQKIIILLLAILPLPVFSQAQKWKRNRKEYSIGFGATNFLGDLGGRNQIGTDGFMDFEIKATRYAASLGYRYQLGRDWFVKGNLIYAKVSGADNLTEQTSRAARQLNFKSNIIELSAQIEYMLIKQKSGHLYKLRGVRGKSWFRFEVYALAGIGGIWYDPKGDRNGTWHRLSPLNTEGQGLPGGPKDYSSITAVIPYGLGIRRNLSGGARSRHFGSWSISLELTMRKTFSDYIDDVSTVYYDSKGTGALGAGYTDDALYFSDPSGRYINGRYGEDQQRGDSSDKDAYMLGIISLNYKPARRRRNLPKF
ncbi:MAG: hypothetical protein JKY30_10165 [Flavobacteriales bacterium]|nr:hypothetical protein [Flavobacteriales bacterium]